jgi:4-amino-4-deoxy-L-arabinose transferase-like glycosyltransferase
MTRARALLAASALASLLFAASLWVSARAPIRPSEKRLVAAAIELRAGGLGLLAPREEALLPWLVASLSVASGVSASIEREVSPLAARMPAALSALVVLLATFVLGLRILGPRGAVVACLALLGFTLFQDESVRAEPGELLAALDTAGLACLLLAFVPATAEEIKGAPEIAAAPQLARQVRRRLAALGLALLGLGVSARGPVAAVAPLLVGVALCLVAGVRPRLGRAWLGLLVGLEPGLFGSLGAIALGRVSEVPPDTARVVGLLPLAIFVPAAALEALRAERQAHRFHVSLAERLPTLLPLVWLAATLLAFAIPGRRASDLTVALPAAALLLAWSLERAEGSKGRLTRVAEKAAAWALVGLGVAWVPAMLVLGVSVSRELSFGIAAGFVLGGGLALRGMHAYLVVLAITAFVGVVARA